ncbi:MAG TPA: phosphotransferase [Vulgatibacter sp.]|nr:phosphotransferase [Vulgatibacter sp.]
MTSDGTEPVGCPGTGVPNPPQEEIERYLTELLGRPARIAHATRLDRSEGGKGFGYGALLRLTLLGEPRDLVLHRAGTRCFGHDNPADRAYDSLLAFETYGSLPGHVPAVDVGFVDAAGRMESMRWAKDFFFLTEYAEGLPYHRELAAAAGRDRPVPSEVEHAERLALRLARIHQVRRRAPDLYKRRLRQLVGGDECIAGIIDGYDGWDLRGYASPELLFAIEERCVRWRHRLKGYASRLCRVHGDFHPWNILFHADEPILVDRSRGEWGEAADDVAALAINFVFFALMARGHFAGSMVQLWQRFFECYLEVTDDEVLGEVIAPYFAWRALVLASPIWYPSIDRSIRRRLFRFAARVLDEEYFDHRGIGLLLAERG